MEKKQWDTVNEIVDKALDLEEDHRAEYISKQCADDKKLKEEVAELLQYIAQSENENFLESPKDMFGNLTEDISRERESLSRSAMIGEIIENYRITELIDHGGMGSVFKASRKDETYQKEVALKLLRRGMDTPSNILRFKRETNILANLDHPNITRLLDGGVTPEGLPFLVMDYVDGTPLLEYSDQNKLSVEQRITLFKQVCQALHHAHKNAIIHRDLKPSNILVTKQRDVKVLDFGIAKMLESHEQESSNFQTVAGNRILTLRYAAPEMVANESVTTATDSYALGILLFELLAGVHPFEFEDKKIREIERQILEDFVDSPSSVLKDLPKNQQEKIARNRDTTSTALAQKLNGELDAIVLKAVRKKPDMRYGSPQELLDDLKRRERNQPISAKENTFVYRLSKFFGRRKKEVSVGFVFIAVITGFMLFHTNRITDERNIAQQEARRADEVSSFLIELFDTESSDTLSAAGLLRQGMDHLNELENQPGYAGMLSVMGQAYLNFGDYEKAENLLRDAMNESENFYGEKSPEHAEALFLMGNLYQEQHEWKGAVEYFRESYILRSELLGENHTETVQALSHLGTSLRNVGKLEQSETYARRAVQFHEEIFESTNEHVLNSRANLAYVLREMGKFEEAESIYQEVIENANRNPSIDTTTLAIYHNNLGYLYRKIEEYNQAVRSYKKALDLKKEAYVEGHPEIITTRKNLATSYYFLDSLSTAATLLEKNLSETRKKYSTDHWRTASAMNTLAMFYLRNKQFENAESYLRQSTPIYRDVLGEDHLWTAYSEGLLAACLKFQNKNQVVADSLYQHHYHLFEQDTSEFDSDNQNQLRHLIDVYSINGENGQIVADYHKLLH